MVWNIIKGWVCFVVSSCVAIVGDVLMYKTFGSSKTYIVHQISTYDVKWIVIISVGMAIGEFVISGLKDIYSDTKR